MIEKGTLFSRKLAGAGKWLLAAAFLLTPLTTLRPHDSVTFGDLFVALAFALGAALILLRRRFVPIPTFVWSGSGLILLAVLFAVVSPPGTSFQLSEVFGAPPYSSSLAPGLRFLVALVALPVVVAVIVDRWQAIPLLVNAWITGVTVSCLVAVTDAFTGTNLQEAFADNTEVLSIFQKGVPPRFLGLSVHPTSFSVTAVMAFPLVLAQVTSPKSALRLAPIVLLLLLGIVLSGSRVGLVGIAFVLLLSIGLSLNLRKVLFRSGPRTIGLVATVSVITLAVFFLGPPVDPSETPELKIGSGTVERVVPSGIATEASNDDRMRRWKGSITFFTERPFFGYGFEWIEASHNIYLQLLVAGGIVALTGFILVMLGYFKAWLYALPRARTGIGDTILGLGISGASFLLMGFVQTDLLDRYLYLPAGLIMAAYFLSRNPK